MENKAFIQIVNGLDTESEQRGLLSISLVRRELYNSSYKYIFRVYKFLFNIIEV